MTTISESVELVIVDEKDITLDKETEAAPICGVLVRAGSQNGKARYKGVGTKSVSCVFQGGGWIQVNVAPNNYYLIPHTAGWNCYVPPR